MTLEIKYSCDSPAEFVQLLTLVAQNNLPAASSFEVPEYTAPAATPKDFTTTPAVVVAQPAPEPVPEADELPFDEKPAEPEKPAITLDQLKTLGRKLAAAGKGDVLKTAMAAVGATSMSKVPAEKYAELYAALAAAEV